MEYAEDEAHPDAPYYLPISVLDLQIILKVDSAISHVAGTVVGLIELAMRAGLPDNSDQEEEMQEANGEKDQEDEQEVVMGDVDVQMQEVEKDHEQEGKQKDLRPQFSKVPPREKYTPQPKHITQVHTPALSRTSVSGGWQEDPLTKESGFGDCEQRSNGLSLPPAPQKLTVAHANELIQLRRVQSNGSIGDNIDLTNGEQNDDGGQFDNDEDDVFTGGETYHGEGNNYEDLHHLKRVRLPPSDDEGDSTQSHKQMRKSRAPSVTNPVLYGSPDLHNIPCGPGGILFPMETGGPIYADVIYIIDDSGWAGRNIIMEMDLRRDV
ncbi:hypothetical protein DFJ58DRAFT_733801 [Suillus subalutaceus]|uniref:uncharacterized protein n=1 Tax=Suillus subalutaceus TaxID=48586 RepID=UPI001B86C172|nr:uncharacterized protein DFJ58DRAFT_733801 [Suillus subalutaceus]KAG1838550.1 hypothetical protein DFJ58DRAFT_733801 [Suillus subalutaceus]